jgi:hypothetical protein
LTNSINDYFCIIKQVNTKPYAILFVKSKNVLIMKAMGFDKLKTPFNLKKASYQSISLVGTQSRINLVRVTSEEIKSKRNPAYKYLLP